MTSSGFELRAVLEERTVSVGILFLVATSGRGVASGVLTLHVRRRCCRMESSSAQIGRV